MDAHERDDGLDSQGLEIELELRRRFRERGLSASPYTRLRVAVALVQELDAGRELGSEREAVAILAARVGCASAQARLGLRTLRKAGCLLDRRGWPLLSHTVAIGDCVSRDPLALDELCVRALSRIADAEMSAVFDGGPAAETFARIVGRGPIADGARALAIEEVRAHATNPIGRRPPTGAIYGALASAGLDPVTSVRRQILEQIAELANSASDLTAGELAVAAAPEDAPETGVAVVRALLIAGAMQTPSGDAARRLDDHVGGCVEDAQGLELACRTVYRQELERRQPELLADKLGEQAFEQVLSTPRPVFTRQILETLRAADLDPEPNARTAILKEIVVVLDHGPRSIPQLLDAVTEVLPVSRRQVRNIVNALRRCDALVITGPAGSRQIDRLVHRHVGTLDGLLAALYAAEARRRLPDLAARTDAQDRIERAIAYMAMTEVATVTPIDAAIRRTRCLVDQEQRQQLLTLVRDTLDTAPDDGMTIGALREEVIARGEYRSSTITAHLRRLAEAGMLRAPDGTTPRVLAHELRISALALESIDAVDSRLVDAWIAHLATQEPDLEPAELRARMRPPATQVSA